MLKRSSKIPKRLSKIPIEARAQRERNACNKGTKRVTTIFYNKTELTQ